MGRIGKIRRLGMVPRIGKLISLELLARRKERGRCEGVGVRVRVRISSKMGSAVEAASLLNTGFESESPEVLVPVRVAEALGFWPKLPEGAVIRAYETAGGVVRMPTVEEGIEVQVVASDRITSPIKCLLVISEEEREVLLSDKAIEEFGIVIEGPGSGIWRFKDEPVLRESVAPQYW
jgi:hypothetical protein